MICDRVKAMLMAEWTSAQRRDQADGMSTEWASANRDQAEAMWIVRATCANRDQAEAKPSLRATIADRNQAEMMMSAVTMTICSPMLALVKVTVAVRGWAVASVMAGNRISAAESEHGF
jgi:hypothetical protein